MGIFTYIINLPNKVKECVTPCLDGYTIYINENLSDNARIEAYNHAMKHIKNNDFEKSDVQSIEEDAHEV